MRDAYVGNRGDFAKYSLLRALTGRPDRPEEALPLHMVWFRVRKKSQHAFVVFRPGAVQGRLDGLTRRFWQQATDPSVSLMSASPEARPETVRLAPAAGPGRRPHRSTQRQRPNPPRRKR